MLPLETCIRHLFDLQHIFSSCLWLKKGSTFSISLSSDILKSSFLSMPPLSFWHVLAHPHLSKGLKSPGGKRPNTRVKQKLPVWLLFFSERIPFKAVDTVQSPAQSYLLSFGLCCRCPQLADAAPQDTALPWLSVPLFHRDVLGIKSSRSDTMFR